MSLPVTLYLSLSLLFSYLCETRSALSKLIAAPAPAPAPPPAAAPPPAPPAALLALLPLLPCGCVAVCGSGGLHGVCLCDLKHGSEQYRMRHVGHLYLGGASLQTPHFTTGGGAACCCELLCRLFPRPPLPPRPRPRFPAPRPLPPPCPPLIWIKLEPVSPNQI